MHARSINGILEGRKTQTRRIVKPSVKGCTVGSYTNGNPLDNEVVNVQEDGDPWTDIKCPYGQPGDRLWVRETWAMNDVEYGWGSIPKTRPPGFGEITYRADGEWKDQFEELDGDIPPWRPSIFMPRWASRLTLKITGIRVERVQDISDVDCEAEGCRPSTEGDGHDWLRTENGWHRTFRQLWDDTNGAAAWDRNEWCWCIAFKRIQN